MGLSIDTFTDFEVIMVLSFVMLLIGLYGLITNKSAIKVIMAIEIMVSAPNLAFIGLGYTQGAVDSQTQAFVIISLSIGAAVIGLALAFLRNLWKHFETTGIDAYTTLKW
ncbi:MAG: NADH-quinone oxidoreductase subunit NuoK [Candidatus Hodarchaeota archaeon]